MLKIAARFASGALGVGGGGGGRSFYDGGAGDSGARGVDGEWDLVGGERRVEGGKWDDEVEEEEDGEDDFGVPLRSPVRLAGDPGLRERRGWDVD